MKKQEKHLFNLIDEAYNALDGTAVTQLQPYLLQAAQALENGKNYQEVALYLNYKISNFILIQDHLKHLKFPQELAKLHTFVAQISGQMHARAGLSNIGSFLH